MLDADPLAADPYSDVDSECSESPILINVVPDDDIVIGEQDTSYEQCGTGYCILLAAFVDQMGSLLIGIPAQGASRSTTLSASAIAANCNADNARPSSLSFESTSSPDDTSGLPTRKNAAAKPQMANLTLPLTLALDTPKPAEESAGAAKPAAPIAIHSSEIVANSASSSVSSVAAVAKQLRIDGSASAAPHSPAAVAAADHTNVNRSPPLKRGPAKSSKSANASKSRSPSQPKRRKTVSKGSLLYACS